jgi:hypothetical protein
MTLEGARSPGTEKHHGVVTKTEADTCWIAPDGYKLNPTGPQVKANGCYPAGTAVVYTVTSTDKGQVRAGDFARRHASGGGGTDRGRAGA